VRTPRQDEIIHESLALIAEHGVEGLTYRHLSERFGISVPAFYRHFASKADILAGILDYLQEVSRGVFESAEPSGSDALDRLRLVLTGYAQRFAEDGGLAAVLFADEIGGTDRALQERVLLHMDENRDRLTALLSDAAAAGLVRPDVPAKRLAFVTMASLRLEVARWRLGGRTTDLVAAVAALWADLEVILRPPRGLTVPRHETTTDTPYSTTSQGTKERETMYCFQCQETAKNTGCTVKGVCGKPEETANLQDLLIFVLKGMAVYEEKLKELGLPQREHDDFVSQGLFATITNGNFDDARFTAMIDEGLRRKAELQSAFLAAFKEKNGREFDGALPEAATWTTADPSEYAAKATAVGVLATENEDVRSLRELLTIGVKGIAAYNDHAAVLGFRNADIDDFIAEALASTTKDLSVDEMVALVLKAGETAVSTMALLDEANTSTYGSPEITEVNLGVRGNPGILISGHDLKDMEELLAQTEGTGVDVYTHGEMLPANSYPAFKKYDHFVGNYGGSWWHQNAEFEAFNGPILLTTNCLVPLKKDNTYLDRLYTTGVVGYQGATHIPDRASGGAKDFSALIAKAKTCSPPTELETGSLVGGFAHDQVLALADKVVEAVKSGAIKRFVVMAGCDGRHKTRDYFTEVAEQLPPDTVILTAGCAKYRYNKLALGDIGGIPRVLDAGQCNDSYSLAVIALKLKEAFGLDDINDLPVSYDIAWYEQKAVAVLLALLHLGVKGIRLGPTLPAFLSPNVAKVLVDNFDIKPIGTVEDDVAAIVAGK